MDPKLRAFYSSAAREAVVAGGAEYVAKGCALRVSAVHEGECEMAARVNMPRLLKKKASAKARWLQRYLTLNEEARPPCCPPL